LTRNGELRPVGTGGVTFADVGQDVRFPVSMVVLDVPAGPGNGFSPTETGIITINVVQYPELLMFGVGTLRPWHGDIGEHPAPAIRQGRAMQHAQLHFLLNPSLVTAAAIAAAVDEFETLAAENAELMDAIGVLDGHGFFNNDLFDDAEEYAVALITTIVGGGAAGAAALGMVNNTRTMTTLMETRANAINTSLATVPGVVSFAFVESIYRMLAPNTMIGTHGPMWYAIELGEFAATEMNKLHGIVTFSEATLLTEVRVFIDTETLGSLGLALGTTSISTQSELDTLTDFKADFIEVLESLLVLINVILDIVTP
jgi:hypothetical protein